MSVGHDILHNVDWAVVSTVALTMITANYARHTRQLLRATARQAEAAERTLEVLVAERNRQLREIQSPIRAAIRHGQNVARQWLALDFNGLKYSNVWPDSRDLECPDLPQLIQRARASYFPLAETLQNVEQAIVSARVVVDELSVSTDDLTFASGESAVRVAMEELTAAWDAAEAVMDAWE